MLEQERFRYKLTLEYDGMKACGWQRQVGSSSIQETLEKAVLSFSGHSASVLGAGRTDSGVHALGQVAHVDFPKFYDPLRVQDALNFYVRSSQIAILSVELVPLSFHARFSATSRTYFYEICNRRAPLTVQRERAWHVMHPLDIKAMEEAAQFLLGHHDFTSFRATTCQSPSALKTLDELSFLSSSRGESLQITLKARSFLHHQVRIIMGTLVLVGRGKWHPLEVKKALDAKDRRKAGPTAPPYGLYLAQVSYD